MDEELTKRDLEACSLLNVSEFARESSRTLRTVQMYLAGDRRVTRDAGRELLEYLRQRCEDLTAAADALQAAIERKERDGPP